MKTTSLLLSLFLLFAGTILADSQDVYTVSSGETIFSWAEVEFTDDYLEDYPDAQVANTPVRYSSVLHLGEYIHLDIGNNLGFFTGLTLRNIGFITDEVLPMTEYPQDNTDYQNYKIIRRSYTLGIPLALKLGSFKDNLYVFAGGEYEWALLWKEKYWNSHSRSGTKSKDTKWFPDNMQTFLPSVFVGIQFPKGFNLKFKYYMNDFTDHSYTATGNPLNVSNLSRYKTTQTMYISLSFQIHNNQVKERSSEGLVSENL